MMSRLLLIAAFFAFTPFVRAQTDSTQPPAAQPPAEKHTTSSLSVTVQATAEQKSQDQSEVFTAVWVAGLEGKLHTEHGSLALDLFTRMRYGQSHSEDAPPQKTEDDLIVSVTPSIDLPATPFRLFLENTAETQFRPGHVDSVQTNFMDPLMLYEALFVGKRYAWQSEDGNSTFDFTGGVGYALQQTLANEFPLMSNRNIVVTDKSPLSDVQSSVTLESGYCAILEINWQKKLSDLSSIHLGFKNVALTKDDGQIKIENARATSLLEFGVQYGVISLDYSGHMIYDRNVSQRRQLDQSLVFGLRLDL